MSRSAVVAIVSAYNEADVVGWVVRDLIAQGVSVYFLDDGSTDGTMEAVSPFVNRGVLRIEQLGAAGSTPERFEWEKILRRKEELAIEIEADWFIHHDADEFRESPWRGMALADAVALVDRLGFNAIDALSLDFWPTHDRFEAGTDVREAFTHYAPGASHDRRQIRCWKKSGARVDLASSGGHEAQFPGRRVFPIRFVQRHYPVRGQAHGERKVVLERGARFSPAERARGWHVQYDQAPASFLRDPATLTPFDGDRVRAELAINHRGVEELEDTQRALSARLNQEAAALAAARREVRDLEQKIAAESTALREARAAHQEAVAAHQTAVAAHCRQRDEWDASRRELEGRQRRLEERLAATQRDVDELRARLTATEGDLAARERDLDGHRRALGDATRRLLAVEQSWSWRLASPARSIFRLLTGRSQ